MTELKCTLPVTNLLPQEAEQRQRLIVNDVCVGRRAKDETGGREPRTPFTILACGAWI
jgi:hypothetical protein